MVEQDPKNTETQGYKLSNSESLELWKYFSSRADQSGTAIRTILFTAANVGILICLNNLLATTNSQSKILSPYVFSLIAASFLFGISVVTTFTSWTAQKQKSQDRRTKVKTEAKNEELINTLERVMDVEAKNNKKDTRKTKNKDIDRLSFTFLVLGYLAVFLSIFLEKIFDFFIKIVC